MQHRVSITTLLFLSLIIVPCRAQEIITGINIGYASFGMSDLRSFQDELKRQYPLDIRRVESFPSYLNYSSHVLFSMRKFYVGMMIGHTSTGGRLSYRDYSGSFSSDQLVRMTYAGPMIATRLTTGHSAFVLLFGGYLLYYHNNVNFREETIVGTERFVQETKFQSANLATGPYLELQRKIRRFVLRGTAGAEIHICGFLTSNQDSNAYLMNSSQEKIKVQAGGFRLNIGLGYALYSKK